MVCVFRFPKSNTCPREVKVNFHANFTTGANALSPDLKAAAKVAHLARKYRVDDSSRVVESTRNKGKNVRMEAFSSFPVLQQPDSSIFIKNKLLYKIIHWYVRNLSFPRRGLRFFLNFFRKMGQAGQVFQKRIHNGMLVNIHPEDHIQQQILWYGYYEKKYVLTWETFIARNDVVIDVGANMGYYSLVASGKSIHGMTYAFEPDTSNYLRLEENRRLNKIENIVPVKKGVTKENTKKYLFVSGKDNKGMSGFLPAENFSNITEFVDCVSLDSWTQVNDIQKVNFIKLDIEGSEYDALLGMTNILRHMKPVVFIEICQSLLERHGIHYHQVYDLLHTYGYKAYGIIVANFISPLSSPVEDELVVFLPEDYVLPEAIIVKKGK